MSLGSNSGGLLPLNTRRTSLHDAFHFRECRHRGITRRRHGQRTVGTATVHGPLRAPGGAQTIDQAGSERVAASDAVENFEVYDPVGLVQVSVAVAHGAPIVARGRLGVAEGGRHDFQVWIVRDNVFDHSPEASRIESREVLVNSFDRESERRHKVLFVPEHYIDEPRKLPVYFEGLLFATNGFPERGAIVQIIGNDRPVPMRGFHRLPRDQRSTFGKRAKDTPGVKPARALLPKNEIPVDLPRLQLRNGCVSSIGAPQGGPDSEPSL